MADARSERPPDRADLAGDRRWPRRVFGVGDEPDPRFSFANERTFLAWIRTALGFVAAGVALAAAGALSPELGEAAQVVALALIACALICAVTALTRWMASERAMRLGLPLPSSPLLLVVTVVVALTGAGALVVVLA